MHPTQALTFEIWQRHIVGVTSPTWGPYEETYAGVVDWCGSSSQALEELFRIFNIDHPTDFASHSLSVGDRVVLGETTFECKSMGWEACEHPTLAPELVDRYMF